MSFVKKNNDKRKDKAKFLTGSGEGVSAFDDALCGDRMIMEYFRESVCMPLTSFDVGVMVFKQVGPWGDNNELLNQGFIIKSIFRSGKTWEVNYIRIQNPSNKIEYILNGYYFNSWTSTIDLKKVFDDNFGSKSNPIFNANHDVII